MLIFYLFLLISFAIAEKNVTINKLYFHSTQQFANKIYQQMNKENENANFVIFPICMQSLLALLHAGAQGETARQIAEEGLSLPTEQVQPVYKKIFASDQNGTYYVLSINHNIYIQSDYSVLDEFYKTATEIYTADIKFVDFDQNPEGALAKINGDIKEETTIENFLPLDKVKGFNVFLYSSFYYRSGIFIECPIRRRINATFFLTQHERKESEFGEYVGYFDYYESAELEAKFLEIPYEGNETVMTIVLPNRIDGLSDLEKNLVQVLQPKTYTRTKLVVRLPDFNVESKIEVAKLFQNIGLTMVFNKNESNFEGITRTNRLAISTSTMQMFHQMNFASTTAPRALLENSTIEVNLAEDGASGFIVDHPFVYMISVRKTGSILVLAKVKTV